METPTVHEQTEEAESSGFDEVSYSEFESEDEIIVLTYSSSSEDGDCDSP